MRKYLEIVSTILKSIFQKEKIIPAFLTGFDRVASV
jgi:hypothetical protein